MGIRLSCSFVLAFVFSLATHIPALAAAGIINKLEIVSTADAYGGVTPPGGNTGAPGSAVAGWSPDLRKSESRVTFALLIKL